MRLQQKTILIMKKNYIVLCKCATVAAMMAVSSDVLAQGEVTIFHEDFGTASSEKDEPLEEHVWGNNPASVFVWTADEATGNSINVRTNNPSDYDGASADGNLYFKGNATFTISGIDTRDYKDVKLSFGAFGKNAADEYDASKGETLVADVDCMKLTCTAGGGTTELADFSKLELNRGSKEWTLVSGVTGVPAADGVSLTFTSAVPNEDGGIRIDDVKLTGVKISAGIGSVNTGAEAIFYDGNSLSYRAANGVAAVYSVSGSRVLTVKAGDTVQLNLPGGIYVAKAGRASLKFVVR